MDKTFVVDKKIIIISYATQFLQYCANFFVLPIILRTVDASTMGLWYLFLSISSMAMLLDFGFSASLSRNVSYVFAGANSLEKEGCVSEGSGNVNYNLLNSIFYTTKHIYLRLALVMFFLLASAGTLYMLHVTNDMQILPTWIIFSVSIVVNYYYNYVNIFIKGRGLITLSNKLIIITKILYLLVIISLLYIGLGLWALIIANFISAFAARLYGLHYFWDKELVSRLNENITQKATDLSKVVWYNAKRMGITGITTFVYSQANVLIAGLFLTLEEVAQLGLCVQIFTILVTICRVNLNTYYPLICTLWVSNDMRKIRSHFLKSQAICYMLFLTGCVVILCFGNLMLDLIDSNTFLPSNLVLLVFALFNFMEVTHGNCCILISSKNQIPFYKADIIACIITIATVLCLLKYDFGLVSFPIAMCCGSIPYNSWKWVYEAFKLLKK